MSPLEDGLIEGLLICPDCGHEKHIYFMSKELKTQRAEIFGTIDVLSKRRTQENLNKVVELREKYKNLFDAEQEKFSGLLEKENG